MSDAWLAVAALLLLSMVPAWWVAARAEAMDRLAALQAGSTGTTLVVLALAAGSGRALYVNVALAIALVSPIGTLLFARFLERWL